MDVDSAAQQIYDEICNRARTFAEDLVRYQTKCYEISTRGSSDIQEDIGNYFGIDCKELLRPSIDRYKASDFYSIYAPYAHYENRSVELKHKLADVLGDKARTLSTSKFIFLCGIYTLTTLDLKSKKGFDDAPQCAVEAITEAIIAANLLNMMT